MSLRDGDADGGDALPDDVLAAEYVLGTASRQQRLELEARRVDEAALAERIVWWEARLHPLSLTVPSVAPSAACSERIRRVIREQGAGRTPLSAVPDGTARPDADVDRGSARPASPSRSRRTRQMKRWRALAIAATLASVALGALLAVAVGELRRAVTIANAPVPEPVEPARRTALSLLRDSDGNAQYIVEVRDDDSVSITALNREPAQADTSLQLWMADGVSGELRPVGLLPRDAWSSVELSSVPLIEREPAFAVSVEPPGGSPEAGPTGNVVFQGTIHPIGDAR